MRELAELQVKAKQENLEASRQLEEARRRGADAAHNAAATIAQVRTDASSSLHESTRKLIETQAEAAKATADAAKQLAEVGAFKMEGRSVVGVLRAVVFRWRGFNNYFAHIFSICLLKSAFPWCR